MLLYRTVNLHAAESRSSAGTGVRLQWPPGETSVAGGSRGSGTRGRGFEAAHRTFPLERWGHGIWHLLTGTATAMLFLAIEHLT